MRPQLVCYLGQKAFDIDVEAGIHRLQSAEGMNERIGRTTRLRDDVHQDGGVVARETSTAVWTTSRRWSLRPTP